MNRTLSVVGPALVAVLAAGGVVTSSATEPTSAGTPTHPAGQGYATRSTPGAHWVDTWVSMPQLTEPSNLPPAPFTTADRVLADSTVRQTIHLSVGTLWARLRISNAFGGADLPVTAAFVARPAGGRAGVSAIQPGSSRRLTFDGRDSVTIPVGAQMVSDPVRFPVRPDSTLTVTLYLARGQASTDITSHPGSRTTSYLTHGDHAQDTELPGAVPVDHWYFISGLEAWSRPGTAAAVMLGDSLTDGRGSTTNGDDRWPDQLTDRLLAGHHRDVAIVNEAAGGNRVLHDGHGPNALGRIDRDVLAQSGVTSLLVFEGVNDIGTADATAAAQDQVAADLIGAFDQIIRRAHTAGIRVYGATITPFGGNSLYDEPTGIREATRQKVNAWIRTSGRFDAVVDFDRVARDPADPRQLLPAFDVGDHLHLNPTGYRALADAVPLRLFGHRPARSAFD